MKLWVTMGIVLLILGTIGCDYDPAKYDTNNTNMSQALENITVNPAIKNLTWEPNKTINQTTNQTIKTNITTNTTAPKLNLTKNTTQVIKNQTTTKPINQTTKVETKQIVVGNKTITVVVPSKAPGAK